MYCYFNDNQVTFRYIDLKAIFEKKSLKSLNECSNFRPKSIGEIFYEPTREQRIRRTNTMLIPEVQDYHEAKNTQNPMTHKT